jgi:siroheme synthase
MLFLTISAIFVVRVAAFGAELPNKFYGQCQRVTKSSKRIDGSNCQSLSLSIHASKDAKAIDERLEKGEPNEILRQSINNIVTLLDSTNKAIPSSPSASDTKSSAGVHIIGTGLTPTLLSLPLSTLHVLSQADIVLYDSLGLSYNDISQIVPRNCQVICVGKRGDSNKSWEQGDIDQLLLKMAVQDHSSDPDDSIPECHNAEKQQQTHSKSKVIVRLKGGDPFLFGRTRSEIETLRKNNISYTYTPGISSCIAGPHLGGIPLTDAALNCQSFAVWSGTDAFGRSWGLNTNENIDEEVTDFESNVDVLVFLMIGRLDKLEALCKLLAFGRQKNVVSPSVGTDNRKWNVDTPCAVIQNAGGIALTSFEKDLENNSNNTPQQKRPIQRVWRSTLGNIVSLIRSEDEARKSVSPAVFVVGKVCEVNLTCCQ